MGDVLSSIGEMYSRKSLAKLFDITDATLNNGVFRPKGHSSVWLFVTKNKPANRTPYKDQLVGDVLRWQVKRLAAPIG
jgi:putative restriction endonuclease